jgi:hypothetical protein
MSVSMSVSVYMLYRASPKCAALKQTFSAIHKNPLKN